MEYELEINSEKESEQKTYFKAFKFKIDPSEDQSVLLLKHFGCTRFLYNYFLKEK